MNIRADTGEVILSLPRALPTTIGMGAYLKASLCRVDGTQARVTKPAGDLGTLEAVERYDALLAALLESGAAPRAVAHDLHPDFHSTRKAAQLPCPSFAVQHHHAHTLATLWENGRQGAVLGLSLDGFGLGPGNRNWGGELLLVDGPGYRRVGHLAPLRQPGGDIAAREPWRMGAAALHRLGRGDEIAARFPDQPLAGALAQMLDRGLNAPETSSCGRLFDAACGLLGVRPVAEFEGQAPMELESMATGPQVLPDGWSLADGILDFSPLLEALTDATPEDGANLFHGTLATGFAALVLAARDETGCEAVALGGGCFLNRVFTDALAARLAEAGIEVLKPRRLSPGDAGLSFGQAIAAALHLERMN